MAPHQGRPISTCINSNRFWIRPTGVWPAKPSSDKLCSAAAIWRTSAAVGAASTTRSMSGCVKTGAGSADTSTAESKTDAGGGRGTSRTDAAAETGSTGTWGYQWQWIRSVKSGESTGTSGYRQFNSATCSVIGWLMNVVESDVWETGGPDASNTGSAAVPLSVGIWKHHQLMTAAHNHSCPPTK